MHNPSGCRNRFETTFKCCSLSGNILILQAKEREQQAKEKEQERLRQAEIDRQAAEMKLKEDAVRAKCERAEAERDRLQQLERERQLRELQEAAEARRAKERGKQRHSADFSDSYVAVDTQAIFFCKQSRL